MNAKEICFLWRNSSFNYGVGPSARFVSMPVIKTILLSLSSSAIFIVSLIYSLSVWALWTRLISSYLIILSSYSTSFFSLRFLIDTGGIVKLRLSLRIDPIPRLGTTLLSRKNCWIGLIRSDWISKSLCVILAGIISFEGPPQFSCRRIAWDSWITVSAYPWIISVGHLTFLITSSFWNLSLTSILANVPSNDLTAYLREV